jgi:hypothetical protein
MGLALFVIFGKDDCVGEDEGIATAATVNDYYDFMIEKAQYYHAVPDDDDRDDGWYNKLTSQEFKNTDHSNTYISEHWYSVYQENVVLDGIFTRETPIIYGDKIKKFIGRLRDAKERVKQQGEYDPYLWERYFELRAIGLCEFALENGYGVELG